MSGGPSRGSRAALVIVMVGVALSALVWIGVVNSSAADETTGFAVYAAITWSAVAASFATGGYMLRRGVGSGSVIWSFAVVLGGLAIFALLGIAALGLH